MASSFPIDNLTSLEYLQPIYALQHRAENFTRLENLQCIDAYIDPLMATSELVLVSSTLTSQNIKNGTESSLLDRWNNGNHQARWDGATNWICSELYTDPVRPETCTKEWIASSAEHWVVERQPIEYCLVGKSTDNGNRCGLHFSKKVFAIIAVCLLIEVCLICWVAFLSKSPTLMTLGDAQAEFLENPDPMTQITAGVRQSPDNGHFVRLQMAEWRPVRLRWFKALGPKMWTMTMTLVLIAIMLGLLVFFMSLKSSSYRGAGTSLPDMWSQGIGRTNGFALVGGFVLDDNKHTEDFVSHIVFVNAFQVIISALYLLCNSCLTRQVVADQWTHFMTASNGMPDRKPLRVSSHVGLQRTSYMLSLPWTYAFPLMLAFAVLHTLIARSCFLVRTMAYGPGPAEQSQRMMGSDTSRVGYSSMGILLATLTGAIIFLSLVANSFRSFAAVPEHLPRLATKTAFISAACQRPDADKEAHLFAVTFMAVDSEPDNVSGTQSTVGRIVLSTDRYSVVPTIGRQYVQPIPTNKHDDWRWIKKAWIWTHSVLRSILGAASSVIAKLRCQ
jgi:hypothetical protein